MHDVVLAWLSGVTGATSLAIWARFAALSVLAPLLLSGAMSFVISARFAALIFSVVTGPVLATSSATIARSAGLRLAETGPVATSFATMARSAGLNCACVATWAAELTWLGAVTRPTKKDRIESAMTVSAMTALRLEWVEG